MESMEPMDIDWNRVVSRFVRDETYEGIEAPHWADLTDPEARTAAVDDDAWFCRPGMYDSAPFPARARVSCCLVAPPSLSLSLSREETIDTAMSERNLPCQVLIRCRVPSDRPIRAALLLIWGLISPLFSWFSIKFRLCSAFSSCEIPQADLTPS